MENWRSRRLRKYFEVKMIEEKQRNLRRRNW